jgi:hypothetical protein
MKTDPKNSDYIVEAGASRNYEPWRDKDEQARGAAWLRRLTRGCSRGVQPRGVLRQCTHTCFRGNPKRSEARALFTHAHALTRRPRCRAA